jgi:ankyrin repeat protein
LFLCSYSSSEALDKRQHSMQIDVGPAEPETALHAAASIHNTALLRQILGKLGPYSKENKELVALLLKPDRLGLTPLHCPLHDDGKLKPRHTVALHQCTEMLIEAYEGCGVSVDQCDARSSMTPLALASATNEPGIVSRLFLAGGHINSASRRNETPLMAAAISGSIDAMQKLLKLGADVHAKTTTQESVLHVAVFSERLPSEKQAQIVNILLDAGADLHAADAEGRTPVDWVASLGNPSLVRPHAHALIRLLQ